MKILVTGGAGFIGAHVAGKLIARGDEVVIIDNFNSYYEPQLKRGRLDNLVGRQAKVYEIDLADETGVSQVFTDHRFDQICHLGAQAGVRYSLQHPQEYIKSNIVGTHNILENARQHNVTQIVFASSSSVYGANTKIPFSETDPVDRPISLYAATKKSNELEFYAYHHLFGIDVIGLRFFTVYGPWGRPDMAYFSFARKILKGEPIDVYNNGQMKRDFTYIDDIVAGVLAALDNCHGYDIFNLGNNQPVALEDFIDLLETNLGSKSQRNYLPLQDGDVVETYADITKAKTKLNWQPTTDIAEGISRFVEWYKNYYQIS
ncbi:MAG: SDR family NAD(P)-dependent oxidoreductase [Patescibacteria group bacterium]|jgi:UDP-glucuronate 4-epimerase|nr:SDR family NAD(P)-dependent oxidoreductase [Patescibacteria group bacterium]